MAISESNTRLQITVSKDAESALDEAAMKLGIKTTRLGSMILSAWADEYENSDSTGFSECLPYAESLIRKKD